MKICPNCNNEYNETFDRQVYCSPQCRLGHYNKTPNHCELCDDVFVKLTHCQKRCQYCRHRAYPFVGPCRHCGKGHVKTAPYHVYCSNRCRNAATAPHELFRTITANDLSMDFPYDPVLDPYYGPKGRKTVWTEAELLGKDDNG